MRSTKRAVVAVLIIAAVLGPVGSSHEFQVTKDPHKQICPAIYNNIVVWQDNRNGNWDIYGCNFSENKEFQITTDLDDQKNPAIYNNIVVWQDNRNGNTDIYGFNLSTKEEFRITMDSSNQYNPAIHQIYVVWQDERHFTNSNIYGYNLATGKEWRITQDTRDQYCPAIHGDMVIWIDERGGNQMYGYNLSTNQEAQICTIHDDSIAIYKDVVVWCERTHGDNYICVYNLTTKKKSEIKAPYFINGLTVSNYIIVWSDWRNRDLDDDIYINHKVIKSTKSSKSVKSDKSDETKSTGLKLDKFAGKKIVFTGFRDKKVEEELENIGAKITGSVSSNTDFVIASNLNENSSKITKAKELEIELISKDEFYKSIGK